MLEKFKLKKKHKKTTILYRSHFLLVFNNPKTPSRELLTDAKDKSGLSSLLEVKPGIGRVGVLG